MFLQKSAVTQLPQNHLPHYLATGLDEPLQLIGTHLLKIDERYLANPGILLFRHSDTFCVVSVCCKRQGGQDLGAFFCREKSASLYVLSPTQGGALVFPDYIASMNAVTDSTVGCDSP